MERGRDTKGFRKDPGVLSLLCVGQKPTGKRFPIGGIPTSQEMGGQCFCYPSEGVAKTSAGLDDLNGTMNVYGFRKKNTCVVHNMVIFLIQED